MAEFWLVKNICNSLNWNILNISNYICVFNFLTFCNTQIKLTCFLHEWLHYLVSESTNAVELPPELCRVVMSPVSANTLRSFTFIPSIMYRIQCLLLSVKLKIQLGPRMQQFEMPALKVSFYFSFLFYAQYKSFSNQASTSACWPYTREKKTLGFLFKLLQ